MPRASKAAAAHHRDLTVQAAARLFRERGIDRVSVQDIMGDVGLTHGGFYRQFDSKEALLAEATQYAYAAMSASMHETDAGAGDHREAQQAYIRAYLSAAHRDQPGEGCPTAGLGPDIARTGSAETRDVLAGGIADFARWLERPGQDGLVTACTLVGALLVARAAKGTPLSDQVLERVAADLLTTR